MHIYECVRYSWPKCDGHAAGYARLKGGASPQLAEGIAQAPYTRPLGCSTLPGMWRTTGQWAELSLTVHVAKRLHPEDAGWLLKRAVYKKSGFLV